MVPHGGTRPLPGMHMVCVQHQPPPSRGYPPTPLEAPIADSRWRRWTQQSEMAQNRLFRLINSVEGLRN